MYNITYNVSHGVKSDGFRYVGGRGDNNKLINFIYEVYNIIHQGSPTSGI